jgi:hypothetical protein
MANPSGATFHYSKQKLNRPGYPSILRDDGSRAEPLPERSSGLTGSLTGMLTDHPLPAFFGAMAIGYLAGCLLSST